METLLGLATERNEHRARCHLPLLDRQLGLLPQVAENDLGRVAGQRIGHEFRCRTRPLAEQLITHLLAQPVLLALGHDRSSLLMNALLMNAPWKFTLNPTTSCTNPRDQDIATAATVDAGGFVVEATTSPLATRPLEITVALRAMRRLQCRTRCERSRDRVALPGPT
jgi:hypothetical protein